MGRASAEAGEEQGWESCSPTQSCPKALGEASLVELTQKNNKREDFGFPLLQIDQSVPSALFPSPKTRLNLLDGKLVVQRSEVFTHATVCQSTMLSAVTSLPVLAAGNMHSV